MDIIVQAEGRHQPATHGITAELLSRELSWRVTSSDVPTAATPTQDGVVGRFEHPLPRGRESGDRAAGLTLVREHDAWAQTTLGSG